MSGECVYDDYYVRRDQLLTLVRSFDRGVSCGRLAFELGWSSHEVRAKLVSLRTREYVTYDGAFWSAVDG